MPPDEAPWADRLARQREFFRRCVGDSRSDCPAERVADLAANAQRRIDQGQHDDAVARCYWAVEYLAQWRLATATARGGARCGRSAGIDWAGLRASLCYWHAPAATNSPGPVFRTPGGQARVGSYHSSSTARQRSGVVACTNAVRTAR